MYNNKEQINACLDNGGRWHVGMDSGRGVTKAMRAVGDDSKYSILIVVMIYFGAYIHINSYYIIL